MTLNDKIIKFKSNASPKEIKSKNYYEIIGVKKDASLKEIKSAAKKKIRKYHTDNPCTGDVQKFREVMEAYGVLRDPELRNFYDTIGIEFNDYIKRKFDDFITDLNKMFDKMDMRFDELEKKINIGFNEIKKELIEIKADLKEIKIGFDDGF